MLGAWQVLKAENQNLSSSLKQHFKSVNLTANYQYAHAQITVATYLTLHIFQGPIPIHTANSNFAIPFLHRGGLHADSFDVWRLAIQHIRISPAYTCSRTANPLFSHP